MASASVFRVSQNAVHVRAQQPRTCKVGHLDYGRRLKRPWRFLDGRKRQRIPQPPGAVRW
jgi:hypothetical protein